MLDITCAKKEKTRVFLFFETYKTVFLLLQYQRNYFLFLVSNMEMKVGGLKRCLSTKDKCISKTMGYLERSSTNSTRSRNRQSSVRPLIYSVLPLAQIPKESQKKNTKTQNQSLNRNEFKSIVKVGLNSHSM